jgi:hypothetical protein
MTTQRLKVRCIPFSREALHDEICRASFADKSEHVLDQVKYLGSYLASPETGAITIIIEHPYVDRHFLEEYANYYATTLCPPPTKATRLHFFKKVISNRKFSALLKKAANNKFSEVCNELNKSYLGFSVIRPLPDAPIGRTVLTTFNNNADRCYTLPPHAYRVHLCGMKLSVCGVPFQQQEQAVGACATTAVWSALAQVMRHDGGRAPTPFAVTEAATRHWLNDRVYPAASGLRNEQVLEAIRQFGYAPFHFEPGVKTDLFMVAVKCYLRSGIPVILKIRYPDENYEAHAVTVVGFREANTAIECHIDGITSYCLQSKGLCRLYIHDDRLGAYARAEWRVDDKGFIQLKFIPHEQGFEDFCREAEVQSAMVPVYPKIRLSAQDLTGFAGGLLPLFRHIAGQEKRDELVADLRFCLAGECLELLYQSVIPSARLAAFAKQAVLSRYVGLITFSVSDSIIAHIIYDSTDMRRAAPAATPLLAILLYPPYDQYVEVLRNNLPRALIL